MFSSSSPLPFRFAPQSSQLVGAETWTAGAAVAESAATRDGRFQKLWREGWLEAGCCCGFSTGGSGCVSTGGICCCCSCSCGCCCCCCCCCCCAEYKRSSVCSTRGATSPG